MTEREKPGLTEISFHFNAPDRLHYACRLLRKTANGGARIAVAGSPEILGALDTLLWAVSPTDFISHCFADDSPSMVAASPVVLGQSMQSEATPDPARAGEMRTVLVNLGDEVPAGFESFERLAELVGTDESNRQLARERWKYYASRGYTMVKHDLAAKSTP